MMRCAEGTFYRSRMDRRPAAARATFSRLSRCHAAKRAAITRVPPFVALRKGRAGGLDFRFHRVTFS